MMLEMSNIVLARRGLACATAFKDLVKGSYARRVNCMVLEKLHGHKRYSFYFLDSIYIDAKLFYEIFVNARLTCLFSEKLKNILLIHGIKVKRTKSRICKLQVCIPYKQELWLLH